MNNSFNNPFRIILATCLFAISANLCTQTIVTLATGLSNPNGVNIDSNCVYWIEYGSGSLKKVPVSGGSVTTLVSGLNSPTGLVLGVNDAYFGENVGLNAARIKKVSKMGGSVTTIVSNLYSISKLCFDNDYIYFTDFEGGKIQKLPISGGSVTTLSSQTSSPSGIIVDSNFVYWVEFTNPGALKKVSKTGGSTTTLSNNSNTIGIAIDNNYVYWAENVYSNQGKINKVPVGGGSNIILAGGLNYAWDLCIDNNNAYWVEYRTNGAIKQASLNGGNIQTIVNNVNEPVSIVSDDSYVYWIERNGGSNGSLKKTEKLLTKIEVISSNIPNSYSLFQNYPNPFNPQSKIKFSLPEKSNTKIIVYDLMGKEMETILNKLLEPGTYETYWDAANYSSGMYFYKIIAGNFIETKKMMLLK